MAPKIFENQNTTPTPFQKDLLLSYSYSKQQRHFLKNFMKAVHSVTCLNLVTVPLDCSCWILQKEAALSPPLYQSWPLQHSSQRNEDSGLVLASRSLLVDSIVFLPGGLQFLCTAYHSHCDIPLAHEWWKQFNFYIPQKQWASIIGPTKLIRCSVQQPTTLSWLFFQDG